MSDEGIRLSDDLIHGIMNLVMEHDPVTQKDMIRALQYLAAVTGYLVADYPGPVEERDELLEHLGQFAVHVANEKAQSQSQSQPQQQQSQPAEQPAAAGRCEQSDNPAVGVWKPE